jgi:amino acid adenylation domain-containing protein
MIKKNIEAIYKLSPLQEGILYHGLESPNSDVYFQQFSCKIDGLFSIERWQQCWAIITQRHTALRTLFTWDKREHPLQIVRERVTLAWQQFDWSNLDKTQQVTKWQSVLQRDRDLGFELSKAPLVRFTVAEIGQGQALFLFSFHHILLDGWSQRLLLDEAITLYQQVNIDANLQTKAPPYANFIDWVYAQDNEQAKQFWSAQLKDLQNPTYIASQEHNKKPTNTQNKQVAELRLAGANLSSLIENAKQHRVTLNTLVLGAWAKVLGNECQTDDVVFGTTVAGRPADLPESDKIAGLFINTLPLRVNVSANFAMHEWLKQVQANQANCRQFEQTALSDIQKWADNRSGKALFDCIVVFENLPSQGQNSAQGALHISEMEYTEFSHYPLAILVDPSEGLNFIAVYQSDKICTEKVNRLLAQLHSLLCEMSLSLTEDVSKYKAISNSERQLTLVEWNQTQVDIPAIQCVHQAIEKWAKITPQKVAVSFSNTQQNSFTNLTYQQLNHKANQLARYLVAKGITRESLVVILLERSIESIVAFLAALKTGAAYIPLDSDNPSQRIKSVLDSVAEQDYYVVTCQTLLAKIPEGSECNILIDADFRLIEQQPIHNLDLPVVLSDLAYVIFTSGSTGQPKGVMIEHSALSHSTFTRTLYYRSQPNVFLMLSSFATDSSIAGIYWTLTTGNNLVIANKHAEQDMFALQQLIARQSVTHILCIPSLYQLILEHCESKSLTSLETIIVAGESCRGSVVRKHQQVMQDSKQDLEYTAELYNEYGPSEATVWTTVAHLTQHSNNQPVPIGKPIANIQIYVLDKNKVPVSIGHTGELYIAGKCLARGYLQQPDLSAKVFINLQIDMPSGPSESIRLYKTGDLVRYLTDGNLEFVGRADNQIKVRGFRIAPEEIENIMSSHPEIDEAAVFMSASIKRDAASLAEQLALLEPEQAQALLNQISTHSESKQGLS